jgi:endonuclease III
MLQELIHALESHYGTPAITPPGAPFDMVVWENVQAIVQEERQKRSVRPLKATAAERPILRDRRLQQVHQLVMELFNGDFNRVLELPVREASSALQLFPGINTLAAEKILLYYRRLPVLAVDRHGLRALLRIGYGIACSTLESTYRCVQEAVNKQIVDDYDWLIRAQQLLRIHGQEVCKHSKPRCPDCPVQTMCAYARNRKQKGS